MVEVLVVLLIFVAVAFIVLAVRGGRVSVEADDAVRPAVAPEMMARPNMLLPWVVGLVVVAALKVGVGVPLWISVAIGVAVGIGVGILLRFLARRWVNKLEFQLADGIDLIVMTLRAGGSLPMALTTAARESKRPLRSYLNELVERIRIGERPELVLADLEDRIPLESFRLFSYALAAHWEGGGSLASTLSNVGRTIRDRVDLARRVSAQAVETQVSVLGVLAITYGLALLMWNNYPDRVDKFISSEIGSGFIALTIFLQGLGLFWISRMTKIEV